MNPGISFFRKSYSPIDETESIHVHLTDDDISQSKVSIGAYGIPGCVDFTSESSPDKSLCINIKNDDLDADIYMNSQTGEWESIVNGDKSLSPDQIQQFFKTDLFRKIDGKLTSAWVNKPQYEKYYNALKTRKYCTWPSGFMKIDEDAQFRKGNIDIEKSREKNAAGQQIRTNSGRLIVTFSDFGVTKKDQAGYYCWPEHGKEFKFSQWNLADKVYDKGKSNPMFLRMSFWHNEYEYGLNLGLREEINDNRGFFGYNLTLEPPVQWTTPIETNQMLTLSIVQKFLHTCKKRIHKYISMDTKYIYDQINNPSKITMDQIENTKIIVKRNFDIVRDPRADTYIYD